MTEILAPTYLTAEALPEDAVGVVVSEGEVSEVQTPQGPKQVFQLDIEVNAIRFTWTLNATSQRSLAEKWGRNAKAWVSKRVKFTTQKMLVHSIEKRVIFGEPLEG